MCTNSVFMRDGGKWKHVMVECPAYEAEQDWAVLRYKEVMGDIKFQEIAQSDDRGLAYLLGFDAEAHPAVIDITKVYLSIIWNRRTKILYVIKYVKCD